MLSKNINPNIIKEKEKGISNNKIYIDNDIDLYNFSMFNYDEKKFINKKEFYQSYFGK
jgi:hypothetical protein